MPLTMLQIIQLLSDCLQIDYVIKAPPPITNRYIPYLFELGRGVLYVQKYKYPELDKFLIFLYSQIGPNSYIEVSVPPVKKPNELLKLMSRRQLVNLAREHGYSISKDTESNIYKELNDIEYEYRKR